MMTPIYLFIKYKKCVNHLDYILKQIAVLVILYMFVNIIFFITTFDWYKNVIFFIAV